MLLYQPSGPSLLNLLILRALIEDEIDLPVSFNTNDETNVIYTTVFFHVTTA
jgi:hypothetical protein